MDLAAFKNRLEELEYGMKELRFDFELDEFSGFKLEELRNELDSLKEEEAFFLKMKIKAIADREKLHTIEHEFIKKAQIHWVKESYEDLHEDPNYCKILEDLRENQKKYDIANKYYRRLDKEKKQVLEKIHEMECRQESFK